ncbi:MAG: CopG family transcriptional regulator [Solirubrobacteraceae bacterium]
MKTTVYLPEDVKYALSRVAAARGESEAEVIRVAIRSLLDTEPRPKPQGALFHSGQTSLASRVDELLLGFGEDQSC